MTSKQRSFLLKKAHILKPVVMIGRKGVTGSLLDALDQVLDSHELVKVKFLELKEVRHKIAPELAAATQSVLVSMLGNTGIFYRPRSDSKKQVIRLP